MISRLSECATPRGIISKNVIKVHTGCYTKEAFMFINAMIYNEEQQVRNHFGNKAFVSTLPRMTDWTVWRLMKNNIRIYSRMKMKNVAPLDGANIEDDGEVTFMLTPFLFGRPDRVKMTEQKAVNAVSRYLSNSYYGTNDEYKEARAKIDLLNKSILERLTDEDRANSLFNEVLGKPFNPFEQQVFKMKKQALIEESNKLYGRSLDKTEKDEITKNISVKFDELIDCLR